jgi:hypothetical protein
MDTRNHKFLAGMMTGDRSQSAFDFKERLSRVGFAYRLRFVTLEALLRANALTIARPTLAVPGKHL